MRIVFTRHPDQAGDMEAAAGEAGYDVGFMPLTMQVLPEDTGELGESVVQLQRGTYDWLLLTSPNTVRALVRLGWRGDLPEYTGIAVVGPGTARVLTEVTGAAADWMPTEHSAAGILHALPAPTPGQRMLLPQSAQARPLLAEGLREQGWELTHVVAYRTVDLYGADFTARRALTPTSTAGAQEAGPLLQPEELHQDDIVLLTSSTAAAAYARRSPLSTPRLVAIGEPTLATMAELQLPVAGMLPHPTAAGLRALLRGSDFSGSSESLDWS